jgi:hypothetical protein
MILGDILLVKYILATYFWLEPLTSSLNYQWYVFPSLGYVDNVYNWLNFTANLSVAYRL